MANDFSSRQDNAQLPSMAEVHKIRTIEAVRPHHPDVVETHFAQFEPIISLLRSYELPTDYFEKAIQTHAVTAQDLEIFNPILTKLVARVLTDQGTHQTLLDAAYDYLAEVDSSAAADIAIVLGGKSEERPRTAARLFAQGLVPKIVCAGNRPVYVGPTGPTEAERFQKILLDEGVPAENILLEKNSRTIPDNIRSVLNLLDREKIPYNRIILVTSPYAMRRAWACLKKYLPQTATVIRVGCKSTAGVSREEWFKTEKTIRVVFNEYVKMAIAETFNDA